MIKINLRSHQWTTSLLGIVMMLLALAFAWHESNVEALVVDGTWFTIGFILFAYRQVLIVDERRLSLYTKTGVLFLFKSDAVPTSDIKKIKLVEKVVRKGNNEITWYNIVTDSQQLICQLKNALRARKVAETLARILEVSFDNHIFGVASTRTPQQLDQPLIARWLEKEMVPEQPAVPVETQIAVEHSAERTRISLPAEHHNQKFILLFIAIITAIGAVMSFLVKLEERFLLAAIFIPAIGVLATLAMAFFGRSSIVITNRHVITRQGLSPVRHKLRLTDIEEFITARDGVYLDSDVGTLWMHWANSKSDSNYLKALISYELTRRYKCEIKDDGGIK